MFSKRKLRRRLANLGSTVTVTYTLKVNNQDPIDFPDEDSLRVYVQDFREHTAIFSLEIYRIEIYSL